MIVLTCLTSLYPLEDATGSELTQSISLVDAYELAKQHDAIFATSHAQRIAGREKLTQGRAQLLPSINFDANYSRTNQDTDYNELTSGLTTTQQNQTFTSNSAGISLVQPLFRMQNLALYRQAQAQVSISEKTFAIAEQDLILRVVQAYFETLIAEESQLARQAQTSAASRSLTEAIHKFEVGKLIITDVDEAQARYDLSRAIEIATVNDRDIKKQALKKIIGQFPMSLASLSKGLPLTPLVPDDILQWEKQALKNSLKIHLALDELKVVREEVARNRGERYPSIDLVASYHDEAVVGDNLLGNGNDRTTAVIGIQFQMPLYSGGERSSRVREAVANELKAREQLREVRAQVILETRQSYLAVSSGRLQIQAFQQAVRSSESSLKTIQRGFEVGKRTNLDVLNAQQQLFETRRDLATAKYNYLNDLLKLKASAGSLSLTDLEAVNQLLSH